MFLETEENNHLIISTFARLPQKIIIYITSEEKKINK